MHLIKYVPLFFSSNEVDEKHFDLQIQYCYLSVRKVIETTKD